VTERVRKLDPQQHLEMTTTIDTAMDNVADADNDNVRLLRDYIEKLLRYSRQ